MLKCIWSLWKVYQSYNSSCAPQEEIDSKLSTGYFVVQFSDTISDPTQQGNPYIFIGKEFYTSFSASLAKEINMYFRHVSTISDDGYIIEDNHEYDSI